MEKDGIARPVKRGGLISPFGYKCINTDSTTYGSVTGCKTYAIKRRIADEYIVRAAASYESVDLFENTEILDAQYVDGGSSALSHWKLSAKSDLLNEIRGVMLLVCDGSTSYLAQKLGLLEKGLQPEATCSHAYVKGDTHQWRDADGVMIFHKTTLPGYSALFRHYNEDMYFGT
jgi:flavin-dependent dehydrogenase